MGRISRQKRCPYKRNWVYCDRENSLYVVWWMCSCFWLPSRKTKQTTHKALDNYGKQQWLGVFFSVFSHGQIAYSSNQELNQEEINHHGPKILTKPGRALEPPSIQRERELDAGDLWKGHCCCSAQAQSEWPPESVGRRKLRPLSIVKYVWEGEGRKRDMGALHIWYPLEFWPLHFTGIDFILRSRFLL